MADDVWFGIHISQEGCNFNEITETCLLSEKHGFHSFTVSDHFMNQFPPYETGAHSTDGWILLGGLAATTQSIKLGTLVTCYAYRPPTVLAKMATTVDRISGGRLIFGIGAGWHKPEFIGYLGRFPPLSERFTGLEETVQICKSMFSNETSSFKGKLYQVKSVVNSPPPIQEHVPILIAGSGEKRTLKIVAKYADISHIWPWGGVEEARHKFNVLRKHCETVGRDYDEIRRGVGLYIMFDEGDEDYRSQVRRFAGITGLSYEDTLKMVDSYSGGSVFRGSATEIGEKVAEYRELDIGFYTFSFLNLPTEKELELLQTEVIPKLT
jgi:F420-dependent oxidoreductase-like protein